MFLQGSCAKFSEEDLRGFKIYQRSSEELDSMHRSNVIKRTIVTIVGLILMVVFYMIARASNSVDVYMYCMLLIFVVICALIIYFYLEYKNRLYKESAKYIEISIVLKLPVKRVAVGDLDYSYVNTYPILARDVCTGYESTVYVDKRVYRDCKCGEVIKKAFYDL